MKDLSEIYNFPYKTETLKAEAPAKEEDIILFTYTNDQLTEMIKAIKALEIIKELFVFQPDKFYPFVWKELNSAPKELIDLLKEVLL